MDKYIENKITDNSITFCFTDKPIIDEREIHSYHEILLYFDGDIELFTVKGHRVLKKPSIVIVPAETYHYFRSENFSGFTRLKISFPVNTLRDTPLCGIMKEIRIIDNFNGEIKYLFDKLRNILSTDFKNAAFHAYSAFMMLISELDMLGTGDCEEKHANKNTLMSSVANYISDNLSSELDIKTLAATMHISPSAITHMFKKEFGISAHSYILQKRLVFAKRLVQEGEMLSKVYSDAGFKDYSSFYKAYEKYFGYAPSKDKHRNE